MTNQKINERVAFLCGWFYHVEWYKEGIESPCNPPNYAESLDACREFENFKTGEEWREYIDTLTEICDVYNDPIVATPLQRCEAFLRLKGQWE